MASGGQTILPGGLRNAGENRCYVNVILQAFAATSYVCDLAQVSHTVVRNNQDKLTSSVLKAVRAINGVDGQSTSRNAADAMLDAFFKAGGRTGIGEQDSHEFFARLLEKLDDLEIGRVIRSSNRDIDLRSILNTNSTHNCQFLSQFRSKLDMPVYTSPSPNDMQNECQKQIQPWIGSNKKSLPGIFAGYTGSSVYCMHCKESTPIQLHKFNCLTVQIPSALPCKLSTCLTNMVTPDPVPGYRCENCSDNQSNLKQTIIARRPLALCFHFNRLESMRAKSDSQVLLEEYIDISSFCNMLGQPKEPGSGNIYRLSAVIEHFGGAYSGHYICLRRCAGGDNNAWTIISDEDVSLTDWSRVRLSRPYIVIYEQCGEQTDMASFMNLVAEII